MNSTVGEPQVGQWYERADNASIFQVTGIDDRAKTVEIQAFDGDIDEIEADTWATLPLWFAQPPEDWIEPGDEMDAEDLACLRAGSALEDPAALERLAP